jgi:hypothetical protein
MKLFVWKGLVDSMSRKRRVQREVVEERVDRRVTQSPHWRSSGIWDSLANLVIPLQKNYFEGGFKKLRMQWCRSPGVAIQGPYKIHSQRSMYVLCSAHCNEAGAPPILWGKVPGERKK